MIDFAGDREESDALGRISALAHLMVDQQKEVERIEALLEEARAALRRTETEDLPQLMAEYSLTEIKLTDGSRVEVKADLHCGITEERRGEAHRWLEARGFGGLIKTSLGVAFGRDERAAAFDAAKTVAETLDRDVTLQEAIHPATLKSFLKEQMALGAEGASPPAELFGIIPYNKAKLTPPKAKPLPKR